MRFRHYWIILLVVRLLLVVKFYLCDTELNPPRYQDLYFVGKKTEAQKRLVNYFYSKVWTSLDFTISRICFSHTASWIVRSYVSAITPWTLFCFCLWPSCCKLSPGSPTLDQEHQSMFCTYISTISCASFWAETRNENI